MLLLYLILSLRHPAILLVGIALVFSVSLLLYPRLRIAFFPRTDAGQFLINLKAQSGTRLEIMQDEVRRVEDLIRTVVEPEELGVILSNIGVTPGFSYSFRACRPNRSKPTSQGDSSAFLLLPAISSISSRARFPA